MQLPADFQTVETRCGREGHNRPRGPSESPDGVDPNIRRIKTQRDGHNSGVKIWSLRSVSCILSQQPFRTLAIKWEVNIILKKSSCVFLPASLFLRLYRCVVVMLHERVNDYITQIPKEKHWKSRRKRNQYGSLFSKKQKQECRKNWTKEKRHYTKS